MDLDAQGAQRKAWGSWSRDRREARTTCGQCSPGAVDHSLYQLPRATWTCRREKLACHECRLSRGSSQGQPRWLGVANIPVLLLRFRGRRESGWDAARSSSVATLGREGAYNRRRIHYTTRIASCCRSGAVGRSALQSNALGRHGDIIPGKTPAPTRKRPSEMRALSKKKLFSLSFPRPNSCAVFHVKRMSSPSSADSLVCRQQDKAMAGRAIVRARPGPFMLMSIFWGHRGNPNVPEPPRLRFIMRLLRALRTAPTGPGLLDVGGGDHAPARLMRCDRRSGFNQSRGFHLAESCTMGSRGS